MVRLRTGFNQKEYYQEWYQRNKEKMVLYMRRYRAEHPDYVERENARKRKKDGYIAKREEEAKKIEQI